MRTFEGVCVAAVGIVISVALAAGTASAGPIVNPKIDQSRFTTERPSSLLLFPKVVNTEDFDTVIQITNTHNTMQWVKCFYVDGSVGPNGTPRWDVTNFKIHLTRQQPTHWSVRQGRPVSPTDDIPGFDAGPMPPVRPGFTGFLVCVEILVDGTPGSANALKGEATVGRITVPGGTNAVFKYPAVGIQAIGGDINGDHNLQLDNIEYAACPGGAILNFAREGDMDGTISGAGAGPSTVSTALAFLPCTIDLRSPNPTTTKVIWHRWNEMEQELSSSFTFQCWLGTDIGDFPVFANLPNTGTPFATVQFTPAPGNSGIVGVANVMRTVENTGAFDMAGGTLHFLDNTPETSLIDPPSVIMLPDHSF